MTVNEDGTVTVQGFRNEDIILSKEEFDGMKLKAIMDVRKYANQTLRESGQKVADGITVRLEPKTPLENARDFIKQRLVESGVIPAENINK